MKSLRKIGNGILNVLAFIGFLGFCLVVMGSCMSDLHYMFGGN